MPIKSRMTAAPDCASSSQSLAQTKAQSGSSRRGPFRGLRRYPFREAGPQSYKAIVDIEHTSLQPNE